MPRLLASMAVLFSACGAGAQSLVDVRFDDGDRGGWTLNGFADLPQGGPSGAGRFLGMPADESFGVRLGRRVTEDATLADWTPYTQGVTFSLDLRLFEFSDVALREPVDPTFRNVVFEFIDTVDPLDITDDVSVFLIAGTLPEIAAGWTAYSIFVPDPSQSALPMGWGGTGAEDPVTLEPMLPANRTYRSVFESLDFISVSTFTPGFFFRFDFYQVGVDNIQIAAVPAPGAGVMLAAAGFGLGRRRRR